MLKPIRTIAPTTFPITVNDVKAWLGVESNDQDGVIQIAIAAAYEHEERSEGKPFLAIMPQTWYQDFPAFAPVMRLPIKPVMEVVSIVYADPAGADQSVENFNYYLFEDETGPYIAPAPGYSWPSTYNRVDAVRITWNAGYADVPAKHKIAMLQHIAFVFTALDNFVAG